MHTSGDFSPEFDDPARHVDEEFAKVNDNFLFPSPAVACKVGDPEECVCTELLCLCINASRLQEVLQQSKSLNKHSNNYSNNDYKKRFHTVQCLLSNEAIVEIPTTHKVRLSNDIELNTESAIRRKPQRQVDSIIQCPF